MDTSRRLASFLPLAAVAVCLLTAGCQRDSDEGFQSYSQAEGSKAATDGTEPNGKSAQPADAGREQPATDGAKTAAPTGTDAGSETKPPSGDAGKVVENADPTAPGKTPDGGANPGDGGAKKKESDVVTQKSDGAEKASDPPTPREVKLLIAERTFQEEGPDGALRISYDDFDLLKVLNMDPVTSDAPELMPGWLKGLHGKRVRVRGFMYPSFEETGLRFFILARDNQICCFGRDPKIYDLVTVRMKEGVTTNYIQGRPFDVVGTFRIQPEVIDDDLVQLYLMEDAVVIDR